MAIKIGLPNPSDFSGDPNADEKGRAKEMRHFLKQLELTVHHAQKALEQLEKDDMITVDSFITFRHPRMNLYEREADSDGNVKVHVDEEAEEMNDIEIEIVWAKNYLN